MSKRGYVEHEIRSEDPSLTPEANQLLTEQLRAVIGGERTELPTSAWPRTDERHARHSEFFGALVNARLAIGVTLLALLVVGAIVALVTGAWWALLIALAVHGLATFALASLMLQSTTEPEHLDPAVAAKLEEEGVANPDAVFNALLDDLAPQHGGRDAAERRTIPPEDAPVEATREQRTAVTPTSEPSEPKPDELNPGDRR